MAGVKKIRFGASGLISAVLALPMASTTLPLSCSSGAPYVVGPVFGVPSACTSGSYLVIPAEDCPATNCNGVENYALCIDGTYGACACSPPPGYFPADAGGDSALEDAEVELGATEDCDPDGDADFAKSCATEDFAEAGPDAPEGGPADGPLFDAGDLGACSGETAKKIPAQDCGDCKGMVAYALCEGITYSTCSCDLPPGYTLVDAGGD
jgi:hypothetical protein